MDRKLGDKDSIYTPKSLDEAIKIADSDEMKRDMADFCMYLISSINGENDCSYRLAETKEKGRAENKLKNKYNGSMDLMGDLARCRIVCDTLEQVRLIQGIVTQNEYFDNDPKKVDRMQRPNDRGYRDVKFVLVSPSSGLRFEMQVTIKELDEADRKTHSIYESVRDITDRQETHQEVTDDEIRRINDVYRECADINRKAALAYNVRVPNGEQLSVGVGSKEGRTQESNTQTAVRKYLPAIVTASVISAAAVKARKDGSKGM